jgi:hypothetical protein
VVGLLRLSINARQPQVPITDSLAKFDLGAGCLMWPNWRTGIPRHSH